MPRRKKLIIVDEFPKSTYHQTKIRLDCLCGSKIMIGSTSKISYLRHMKCHRHVSFCGKVADVEHDWIQFKNQHFSKHEPDGGEIFYDCE